MSGRPVTGPVFATIAAALILLVLAAPADADHGPDQPRAEGAAIAEPVQPLGQAGEAVLAVEVPCEANETGTAWARAELDEAPAFLSFASSSVEAAVPTACDEATHTLDLELPIEISFTEDAPAFEPVRADVDVHVQKNGTDGNTTALSGANATVSATPGYFNLFNVRLDRKVSEVGPQESVRYTVTIENFSNGATRFSFALADQLPEGFEAVLPPPVVVESNTSAEEARKEVTFTVLTPFHNGWVNEIGSIQLRIDSAYAPDASVEGDSGYVSTLTKARGFHIPGPGAAVVGLLLATVSIVRRRASAG